MYRYILFIVILFLVALMVVALVRDILRRGKHNAMVREKIARHGAAVHISVIHMVGLPLAQGVFCDVFATNDKFIIDYNNNTYNLTMDKVVDVTIQTGDAIRRAYQAAGGSPAGDMLFGPLGSMLSNNPRGKRTGYVSAFIIFTYLKDGMTDFLSFDCTDAPDASQMVERFSRAPKEPVVTDL